MDAEVEQSGSLHIRENIKISTTYIKSVLLEISRSALKCGSNFCNVQVLFSTNNNSHLASRPKVTPSGWDYITQNSQVAEQGSKLVTSEITVPLKNQKAFQF
jgi:hypothetical protein